MRKVISASVDASITKFGIDQTYTIRVKCYLVEIMP